MTRSGHRIIGARSVLAVRDLAISTRFYTEVLGFRRDPIDAPGWSFLSRDAVQLMIGECPDEPAAGELGDHSYFLYLQVAGLDAFFEEASSRGAEIVSALANKPWGMREFGLRTPDGHRITFGEPV